MVGGTEPLKARVGKLLKAARKAKGWTQAKLAEEARVSIDMIIKMETGRSGGRFPTIERLASALEVDPGEFFFASPFGSGSSNTALHDLSAKLATLSPSELSWIANVIDAALEPKPDPAT